MLNGCRFYEGHVRVPLVFYRPGVVSAGQKSDALVELTDLAPTMLEQCSPKIPSAMHGRSLCPAMRGDKAASAHRDHVRCECLDAIDMPDETSWPDGDGKAHAQVVGTSASRVVSSAKCIRTSPGAARTGMRRHKTIPDPVARTDSVARSNRSRSCMWPTMSPACT